MIGESPVQVRRSSSASYASSAIWNARWLSVLVLGAFGVSNLPGRRTRARGVDEHQALRVVVAEGRGELADDHEDDRGVLLGRAPVDGEPEHIGWQ
ncbi:MAG: hypothetical protein R3B49_01075 [Phycisphaerales bacterium]